MRTPSRRSSRSGWRRSATTPPIAAHNTFWIPFGKLEPGDAVELETRYGKFNYRITGTRIVEADDRTVLAQTTDPRLVLTTCWPLWAGNLAPQRLAIFARQV